MSRLLPRPQLVLVAVLVALGSAGLRAALDLTGAPSKGSQTAPLTLVEFSDYQCPSCGYYIANVYWKLNRDYVRTGKLRYVVRNFPIARVHPLAFRAHEAAVCAAAQGRFWEMHDRLFAHQQALQPELLERYAEEAGVIPSMLRLCLANGRAAATVQHDIELGLDIGVQATPTIILGFTRESASRLTAEKVIVGEHPYEEYKSAIESLLTRK